MQTLPLDSTKVYTTSIELEGELYNLKVYYAERLDNWFFNISDVDGTPIAFGQKIATNALLSKSFVDQLPGFLLALTSDNKDDADPGEEDLGVRVEVHHLSQAEVDA